MCRNRKYCERLKTFTCNCQDRASSDNDQYKNSLYKKHREIAKKITYITQTQNQLEAHLAKALVISCIDFRLIDDMVYYFNKTGYNNNYDSYIVAGASLGYNNPYSKEHATEWRKTFEDHIDLSIKLHHITEIIIMDHMECGAYKAVYGQNLTPEEEKIKHDENLKLLKNVLNEKYPQLKITLCIMNLEGRVTIVK